MRDTVQLETSIGSQRDGYVFPDVLADCSEGDDLILTLCRIGREAAAGRSGAGSTPPAQLI